MISRINGMLRDVKELAVLVDVGGICYHISVTGWSIAKIKNQGIVGKQVELSTLHYIEGNVALGNLTPRLVGFLEEDEREFFEIFTTVKGVGIRKALCAMNHPFYEIAEAIETGNTGFLRQLPEIGPRTADRIVAEIKGKMSSFVRPQEGATFTAPSPEKTELSCQEEAREILLQLGYKKNEVDAMIRDVMAQQPHIKKSDELVQAIFKQMPK